MPACVTVNFLSLIEAKRNGQALTPEEIQETIRACTAGRIPDYQMAAFLMAVYFRNLDPAETRALTLAMRDSGEVLSFPADARPLVDKHSTGGVGDKVSLVLTPLLACLGFRVPMISGRGLGITGGTLDKLESIPGFQTNLSRERILEVVDRVGCVICGQTDRMVPADKRLYALRDATATVASVPLIVASILSKKLAEGLNALVLDVKFGSAAFMPTVEKARELAEAMVALGDQCGMKTRALLSRMDAPLGRAVGNWLEVKESDELLEAASRSDSAQSPAADLLELVLSCAAHLLVQSGRSETFAEALVIARQGLTSGDPRRKWHALLKAQGADLDAFQRKLEQDSCAPVVTELRALKKGFVCQCDARRIGEVVRDLGAGRVTKDSPIDPDVGLDRIAKPGDFVSTGSTLARIHARDKASAQAAKARLAAAFEFGTHPPAHALLVQEVIES